MVQTVIILQPLFIAILLGWGCLKLRKSPHPGEGDGWVTGWLLVLAGGASLIVNMRLLLAGEYAQFFK